MNCSTFYGDYLISAFGLTTTTSLATLLDNAVSHDRVQRFLARREFTSADLWRLVKPHVRAMQSAFMLPDFTFPPYPGQSGPIP